MSRIVRKPPTIIIKINKGFSRTSVNLQTTRQTPYGYVGGGRIMFGGSAYNIDINIQDLGDSVQGTATFTVMGSSVLRGTQSNAILRKVKNADLLVSAIWDGIPLPGTVATATVKLVAERNKRDYEEGGAHTPEEENNAPTVVVAGASSNRIR